MAEMYGSPDAVGAGKAYVHMCNMLKLAVLAI